MKTLPLCLLLCFFAFAAVAQPLRTTCHERQRKNPEGTDPILVTTCYLKQYRFVHTAYPDYAGRYVWDSSHVYRRGAKGGWVETSNDQVFNRRQPELLALINRRIQQDFAAFKADPKTADCLTGLDSIPVYGIDDLEIEFHNDEIWFQVRWSLGNACRPWDGTIVNLKLSAIRKYLD